MRCIPFYLDDNSNNLPFYLIKDEHGNDIIYINEKNMIYTNSKNNKIGQQLNLFTMCFNQGICFFYKVNDKTSIVKQINNKNMSWYINTNNDFVKIYEDSFDHIEGVNIHFNSKYLCLSSYEYGEACPDVVAGYDLTNNKFLDCNDYNTQNSLYKQLVEIRRCRFDCIASIIKKDLLVSEPDRLYRFLSFIFNINIDENNYKMYLDKAEDYIISKYPELKNIDLSNIDCMNKDYGINYFSFNRMDEDITNLKYLRNKTKIR